MELMEGYKQTEVGAIPEDWEAVAVGSVCGCIVPGRNKPKLFDGDIPWITTPDLDGGESVTSSRIGLCISRSEAKSVGSKIVPPGSVLMSCAGDLGIVALTKNEVVVNQQLHAFLPTDRINAAFLLNALSHRREEIAGMGTKTAVPYLNKTSCNSITIPLPPTKAEQEAIAEALSDADALIESLEQLIAKKRQIKQGAMQELLTGKKRLPGFSGEWELKPLAQLFDLSAAGSKSGVLQSDGAFVVMDMGSVSALGETIPTKRTSLETDLLDFGDLVMPKDDIGGGNIIGRVAFIDRDDGYVLGDHVYRLRPLDDALCPKFFYFLINGAEVNRSLRSKVAGSAQLGLGRKAVLEQVLCFPESESEQIAIANILSDMDSEIAALEAKLAKARQLKQGMMQELLTGNIRLIQPGNSHA